ncbi:amidase family protein [Mesorhizobium sp.]|uniref:amidase n=6 Tax=unclassified Mesorhizobium TaxID=325217 RepID=UPI000FE36DF3|nr:amidase family protein [Mesorhizobium sp.]RWG77793.1 MAG: amidase [Mesorhizobium sp.]RWG79113.1 MAG: amidase [Mesorhizobium sp.]RWK00014.1 MAG: amidase [Mesorhizobium sp.]RWK05794.1 MAG: amidase [Mesorhizobium sp.]RWK14735.1 MAG: amidase [Mesorhizobium sp.]
MPHSDTTFLTARRLAAAIREKKVSAVEAMEAQLARIALVNPLLNAIVTLDEEAARAGAKAADLAVARGDALGPLNGVPVTLKDGHATAGMRTTVGLTAWADYVPSADSTVAARLRKAGAIIIGKTNVPPRLRDLQTVNPIFGRTVNPWDVTRTPGGSSGGAAAAVAAGLVPLEIGSDAGGSVRVPAHLTGICGFKPTQATVPITGSYADPPDMPRSFRLLFDIGPLARDVDDLILAHRIIAGADGLDTEVPPVAADEAPEPPLGRLRVAFAPEFPGVPTAFDIAEAIAGFAGAIEVGGAHVREALPQHDFVAERALFSDLITWYSQAFVAPREASPSLSAYLEALNRRDGFIHAWERFFDDWDVLVCPAMMCTAFRHRETGTPIPVDGVETPYWSALSHACRFNLTGHPAAVIPIGLDREGLPVGAQLVGRRHSDMKLLAAAKALARLTDGFVRPPGL